MQRRFKSGGNWDLCTSFDVNCVETQKTAKQYLVRHGAAVTILAPMSRAFGPLSSSDYVRDYESWLGSYSASRPHAIFCGEVAEIQFGVDRDFLTEQPHPSWMYELQPWPSVLEDDRLDSRLADQCMAGAVGERHPVKKQTGVVASDQRLLQPFEKFICDGSHCHENSWTSFMDKLRGPA